MLRTKRILGFLGILAAGAALGWYYLRPARFGNRVYRIGWMLSPPFQVRGADGRASGISVDLVNEAARRRGISLEWVYWNDSSESALVSRAVDLWSLITITPARLRVLHISEPYLQHDHCLLVRDDSPYRRPEQLATARIGMANVTIDSQTLRQVLPDAVPVPRTRIDAIIGDVCGGSSDAAFMDRFTAITALLQQSGCNGHSLRWIPLPRLRTQLGVGSTLEARAAADAIRREIGVMAQQGKLAEIFGQWGFMSSQDVASVESLVNAERREVRLFAAVLVFALLFGLACWQTLRLIRERTRTRQTEEALRQSQERYLQAQKLESIGRLAGGIAHDFNNLLTVINGYSALMHKKMPVEDPQRWQVEEIQKAGGRAAELTSQLLAFSRKQLIRPRSLNLNTVVEESQKMLCRIIGEDVELITRLDPSLGSVMADPGQIHQILMNLAVNARDAMAGGGKLVIETANEPAGFRQPAPGFEAGDGPCVCLSMIDSGTGMSEETRKNIFEPFFTTKGSKGTGLGLATVYGIVRQSQGWIDVFSAPGQGSTFQIHLPRVDGPGEPTSSAPLAGTAAEGSETVLVVEDQEEVREFIVKALADRGYHVLSAADGGQALELAKRHSGAIDVLLTDVVLPGMNGREVADRFRAIRPAVKVVFTSGYTQDLIADRGILHSNVDYIPKPYTADQIAAKVREVVGKG